MAHGTIIGGWKVSGFFPGRCTGTIITMTFSAVTYSVGVIKDCVRKCSRDMADTTVLIRHKVSRVFPGRRTGTIITMTFCAVINSTGMIKGSARETRCVMADATVLCGGKVAWCFFSGANANKIAIVTGATVASDA